MGRAQDLLEKAMQNIKELSNKCFILFLSALIPFTQYNAKVFDESLIISIDCKIL